jgi:hypothetical protein
MDPLWAPFVWHAGVQTPLQAMQPHASVKSVDTFGLEAREPAALLILKRLKSQSIPPAVPCKPLRQGTL